MENHFVTVDHVTILSKPPIFDPANQNQNTKKVHQTCFWTLPLKMLFKQYKLWNTFPGEIYRRFAARSCLISFKSVNSDVGGYYALPYYGLIESRVVHFYQKLPL